MRNLLLILLLTSCAHSSDQELVNGKLRSLEKFRDNYRDTDLRFNLCLAEYIQCVLHDKTREDKCYGAFDTCTWLIKTKE